MRLPNRPTNTEDPPMESAGQLTAFTTRHVEPESCDHFLALLGEFYKRCPTRRRSTRRSVPAGSTR